MDISGRPGRQSFEDGVSVKALGLVIAKHHLERTNLLSVKLHQILNFEHETKGERLLRRCITQILEKCDEKELQTILRLLNAIKDRDIPSNLRIALDLPWPLEPVFEGYEDWFIHGFMEGRLQEAKELQSVSIKLWVIAPI